MKTRTWATSCLSRRRSAFTLIELLVVIAVIGLLVAVIMPMLMMVYATSVRAPGIQQDRCLAVMFVLSLCFAANCGGPGPLPLARPIESTSVPSASLG